jgi:hypothetical protein
MQQIIVCALALGFTGLQLVAQEKPVLRAKLDLVETATPPPPLKVALGGKALQKYEEARNTALQYLASPSCSKFLKNHWFDAREVAQKLAKQRPQDGAASKISLRGAGIDSEAGGVTEVAISAAFKDRKFLTMAISQPRGVDTYYNRDFFEHKNKYPYSLPVSVIHEALHNLTGENDVAIAQDFGYRGFVALDANIFINDTLKKYCDSKH